MEAIARRRGVVSYTIVVGLFLAALLMGCSSLYMTEGEFFFVRNKAADMPVWVKGNTASGVYLIFLHGGPGDSGLIGSIVPAFQQLEEDYAIVYWDQRASGTSQGNADPATFTVAQFVEDTELIVDAIIENYGPSSIFLFGHSWGGALGAAYLVDGTRQAKIDGFINVDSGHNLVVGLPQSVLWLQNYANIQMVAGNDAEYWQEVADWCGTGPDMTILDNYLQLVTYRQESNAVVYDADSAPSFGPDSAFIFYSPRSLAAFFNPGNIGSKFNILELNLSPSLSNITLPTLTIWGLHDGVNTEAMGQDFDSNIGTPAIDKSYKVFANSGHQPFVEEATLFVEEVVTFVDMYK